MRSASRRDRGYAAASLRKWKKWKTKRKRKQRVYWQKLKLRLGVEVAVVVEADNPNAVFPVAQVVDRVVAGVRSKVVEEDKRPYPLKGEY